MIEPIDLVKCCRCRRLLVWGDLPSVKDRKDPFVGHTQCPHCGCRTFFKMLSKEQLATRCVWGIGSADPFRRCTRHAVYVSTFDGIATEAIWCAYHGYPKTLRKQLERHGIRKIEEVKP